MIIFCPACKFSNVATPATMMARTIRCARCKNMISVAMAEIDVGANKTEGDDDGDEE